mmetsp:Transcript_15498/g.19732  ORF Transcript_15498/g.19732 Transcript_15498/m.19732 type:complete len:116 (-) Transcript_15498:7-354(-)
MESVDTLINIWLEVEKQKEAVTQNELKLNSSSSMVKVPSSSSVPATIQSPRVATGPPLPNESPRLDAGLSSRLENLEKAMALLKTENETLKEKVTQLEGTVSKQGRELRKLKKKP